MQFHTQFQINRTNRKLINPKLIGKTNKTAKVSTGGQVNTPKRTRLRVDRLNSNFRRPGNGQAKVGRSGILCSIRRHLSKRLSARETTIQFEKIHF